MTAPHRTPEYLRWSRIVRKRLIASLPQPCPRCGQMIEPGDKVDLDHLIPVSERPDLLLDASVVRLAHSRCNRRDGQRISTRNARRHKEQSRLPGW